MGGLLFGYDTAVISGAVGSLRVYFIDPQNLGAEAANSLLGFVVSSALIGCILGGVIGGWVSTNIGRKRGLIIAASLFFDFRPRLGRSRISLRSHWFRRPGFLWPFV